MKKTVFIKVLSILVFNSLFAQQKNWEQSIPQDFPNIKILTNKPVKSDLKNSKTIVWNWDTIIAYNQNNNIINKYFQSYDAYGNIKNSKKEEFKLKVNTNSPPCLQTLEHSLIANSLKLTLFIPLLDTIKSK